MGYLRSAVAFVLALGDCLGQSVAALLPVITIGVVVWALVF